MLGEIVNLLDATLRTFDVTAFLVVVGIEIAGQFAAWVTIVFVEGTETVVFVRHIVDLQLW